MAGHDARQLDKRRQSDAACSHHYKQRALIRLQQVPAQPDAMHSMLQTCRLRSASDDIAGRDSEQPVCLSGSSHQPMQSAVSACESLPSRLPGIWCCQTSVGWRCAPMRKCKAAHQALDVVQIRSFEGAQVLPGIGQRCRCPCTLAYIKRCYGSAVATSAQAQVSSSLVGEQTLRCEALQESQLVELEFETLPCGVHLRLQLLPIAQRPGQRWACVLPVQLQV